MREDVALSKRLSYVLRHRPDAAGLEMDEGGWVAVVDVVAALGITRADLHAVVEGSGKQRFAILNERIRAQQGHSVAVKLGYAASAPPDVLWHGTPRRYFDAILREGLRKQQRHAVHLSLDRSTAQAVGRRRGDAVVLRVDAGGMAKAGHSFTLSGNGVWLVDSVPPQYLSLASPPTESGRR